MEIKIRQGDITQFSGDAIVNAANNSLMGGGGVDGAIHRAAGPSLVQACRPLNGCATGDAKITSGFELKARYVIHTVGPVWNNGTNNERELLRSAYRRSLEVAAENNIKTMAFPSISTGAYRFPFEEATHIAIQEIQQFAKNSPSSIEEVVLIAFGDKDYKNMQRIFNGYS